MPSSYQIAAEFSHCTEAIKNAQRQLADTIDRYETERKRLIGKYIQKNPRHEAEFIADLVLLVPFPNIEETKKIYTFNEKVQKAQKAPRGKGVSFDEKVRRAKDFPIPELIPFNGADKALCIFHDEKTPSMKYYQKDNRVHCFGCNGWGDSIDVARHIYQCDFKTAVEKLYGGV